MKITSLGFQNPFFPNYKNPIKFNSLNGINILIGKNNTGKTTILNTIYNELRKDWEPSRTLSRYEFEIDFIQFNSLLVMASDKFKDLEESFHNSYNLKLNDIEKFSDINMDLKKLMFKISFNRKSKSDEFKLNSEVFNPYENNNNVNQLLDAVDKTLASISKKSNRIIILLNIALPKKNIIFIQSLRRFYSTTYTYDADNVFKVNKMIEKMMESSYNNLTINIYDNLDHNVFIIPDLSLILNRIRDDRYTQYHEFDNNFLDKFFRFFNTIFPKINLKILMRDEFNIKGFFTENKIEIDNWAKLGNGTQQLISFLFLLMLPRDYICLIDEPENGLHPELQQIFLKFIKKAILDDEKYTRQFFFATHSASFIDFSNPARVFSLSKSNNELLIRTINENNFRIIRNELGYSPSALFQANGIIWVEGPSDIDYVKMLLKCFDHDVEKERIMIVPFFGDQNIISNHLNYDILKEINPNFSIMMDSDRASKSTKIAKDKIDTKKKFESKGIKFWVYEVFRDIEGILPQEFLNDYFNIDTSKGLDYQKDPFEKLENYVNRLKDNGYIALNAPAYKKKRDSKKFSIEILDNEKYCKLIRSNDYLEKNIKILMEAFKLESIQQKYNFQ